jgi:hypothetical protein
MIAMAMTDMELLLRRCQARRLREPELWYCRFLKMIKSYYLFFSKVEDIDELLYDFMAVKLKGDMVQLLIC